MQINISYDQATNTLPTGFTAAVQRVVTFLDSEFTNNVTMNLHVGYGELNGNAIGAGFQAQNSLSHANILSYTTLRQDLVNAASSADDQSSIQHLPTTDPIGGTHNWWVGDLEQRALGIGSGAATGYVGFELGATSTYTDAQGHTAMDEWDYDRSDGISPDYVTGTGASAVYHHVWDFEGDALHEITELMGRTLGDGEDTFSTLSSPDGIADYTPEDLFRFSSSGVPLYTGRGGYASPDNGATILRYFNPSAGNADPGDWDGTRGDDSFNSPVIRTGVINDISTQDLRVMDLLGWTVSDDYSADTQFSGELAINYGADPRTVGFGTTTALVNYVGDTDWFRVNLTAGTSYRFNEQGAPFGTRTLYDTNLYLYNSSSAELARSYSSYVGATYTPDAELFFTPTTSGDYYLSAGAVSSVTGTYTLSATPDDYSDSVYQGGTVVVGGTAHGSIEIIGDADWFRLQLVAGTTYVLREDGAGVSADGTLTDPLLDLYSSSGALLTSDDDSGPGHDSRIIFTPSLSGNYYLSAEAYSHTGTYTVSANLTSLVTAHDFDGDGKSDILLQNASGDLYDWTMNGAQVLNSAYITTLPPSTWSMKRTGDLNGDGKSDILWQNTSGDLYDWTMNGSQVTSSTYITTLPPSTWSVKGTGDFNGDGMSDILLQNTSGNLYDWTMNGSQVASSTYITTLPPSTWSLKPTGDFNGDGKSDILLQNTSGDLYDWTMNGAQVTSSTYITTLPTSTWSLKGTGDFNGDGKSDILLQNTSGDLYDWTMNGAQVTNSAYITTLPPSTWSLKETGDFNGDGKSDILWQNTSGDLYDWTMNGAQVTNSAYVTTLPTSQWSVLGG